MLVFQEILNLLTAAPQKNAAKLVAIDGRGGSGKSRLAEALRGLDRSIKILQLDFFPCLPEDYPFHPTGTQTRVNVDRLVNEAIIPLSEGRPARFAKTFWWKTTEPSPIVTIKPGNLVLVEGCYSLLPELRSFYDYSIWIQCPPMLALERAMTRDGEKARIQWEEAYFPNESRYVQIYKPAECADLIVRNEGGVGFQI